MRTCLLLLAHFRSQACSSLCGLQVVYDSWFSRMYASVYDMTYGRIYAVVFATSFWSLSLFRLGRWVMLSAQYPDNAPCRQCTLMLKPQGKLCCISLLHSVSAFCDDRANGARKNACMWPYPNDVAYFRLLAFMSGLTSMAIFAIEAYAICGLREVRQRQGRVWNHW